VTVNLWSKQSRAVSKRFRTLSLSQMMKVGHSTLYRSQRFCPRRSTSKGVQRSFGTSRSQYAGNSRSVAHVEPLPARRALHVAVGLGPSDAVDVLTRCRHLQRQ